jgi:hypothetical protein
MTVGVTERKNMKTKTRITYTVEPVGEEPKWRLTLTVAGRELTRSDLPTFEAAVMALAITQKKILPMVEKSHGGVDALEEIKIDHVAVPLPSSNQTKPLVNPDALIPPGSDFSRN